MKSVKCWLWAERLIQPDLCSDRAPFTFSAWDARVGIDTLIAKILLFGRPFVQVAQLSQRDRATHELLRFAKLRSGIFEPPFWGLMGNVDPSCVRRWKKRGRLPIGDNWTLFSNTPVCFGHRILLVWLIPWNLFSGVLPRNYVACHYWHTMNVVLA